MGITFSKKSIEALILKQEESIWQNFNVASSLIDQPLGTIEDKSGKKHLVEHWSREVRDVRINEYCKAYRNRTVLFIASIITAIACPFLVAYPIAQIAAACFGISGLSITFYCHRRIKKLNVEFGGQKIVAKQEIAQAYWKNGPTAEQPVPGNYKQVQDALNQIDMSVEFRDENSFVAGLKILRDPSIFLWPGYFSRYPKGFNELKKIDPLMVKSAIVQLSLNNYVDKDVERFISALHGIAVSDCQLALSRKHKKSKKKSGLEQAVDRLQPYIKTIRSPKPHINDID